MYSLLALLVTPPTLKRKPQIPICATAQIGISPAGVGRGTLSVMRKDGQPELDLATLEDVVARQSRKQRTEAAILGSIALAGVLSVAVLAPNAVQVLGKMIPDVRPLSQKQSVRRAIGRLIKHGSIVKEGGRYALTDHGRDRLARLRFVARSTSNRKRRWDKKWRIVIFDIKEGRKSVRDELRRILVKAGFVQLQKSVWVFPYRCDETIALLKFHLTLGWDLVYIIADAIEGDEELRHHFGLPSSHDAPHV